ncbi:MAG: type IV pilin protein [Candidatus Sumerlaeaceae bacterium]
MYSRRPIANIRAGFTLIELLIVVAIIAILASIALPNFIEAQVRAKVARAKADLRTMATGLEAYHADNNRYPDLFTRIRVLSTPVAYISSLPRDIFRAQQSGGSSFFQQRTYRYGAMPIESPSRWAMDSVGPDTDIDTYFNGTIDGSIDGESEDDWQPDRDALRLYPGYSAELFGDGWLDPDPTTAATYKYVAYDSTNGSVSNGDIFRLSDHQMP